MESKILRVAVIVAVIAAAFIYEFGVKSPADKAESWKGQIVGTYRKRDWMRGFRKVGRPKYHYYDYFWEVKCEDGETRMAEVPHSSFGNGTPGDPVIKVKGERYPRVNTREALEAYKVKQEFMGDAVEGAKDAFLGRE